MSPDLKEIEYLVEAARYCNDEDRHVKLIGLVKESIECFSGEDYGKIDWLKIRLPNFIEGYDYGDDSDKKLIGILCESAYQGCKEAQYDYACFLYENQKYTEAIILYKKSADQGYAPSQWAYGIDRLNGIGTEKNLDEGIFYIQISATQGYEYALDFLISSYSEGHNGLNKDDKELEKWLFIKSYNA